MILKSLVINLYVLLIRITHNRGNAAISTASIFFISIIFYKINESIKSFMNKRCVFAAVRHYIHKISKKPFVNEKCVSVYNGFLKLPAIFLLLIVVDYLVVSNILHGTLASIVILIIGVFTSVILIFNKSLDKNDYYEFIFSILLFLIFAIPLLLYKLRLV